MCDRPRSSAEPRRDTLSGVPARGPGTGVLPVALAGITFLVFVPALWNGFVDWDDPINLLNNRDYRGLGWTQLRWMATAVWGGHYIPLTWVTFGLDYVLWGMNPAGYHLTNVLLHAINTGLFYLVARRLLGRATTLSGAALAVAAATAALFFGIHPLRAESVAWVTERRDLLSGCFFLLAVLAYVAASEAEGARRRWCRGASVGCYILASAAKAIVMTAPLVLVLLDVYPLRRLPSDLRAWFGRTTRPLWLEKLPYLAVALATAVMAYHAQAAWGAALTPLGEFPLAARASAVLYFFWFYLAKTALPVGLSPLYELPARIDPSEARFLLSAVAIVGISLAVLVLRRRWPAGLALWTYHGVVLLPVSGIVSRGIQIATDRYSYLGCLGWALLVGAGAGVVMRARGHGAVRPSLARIAVATAVAYFVGLGVLTWQQVEIWRDTETLWSHAVWVTPDCAICQNRLGEWLLKHGAAGPALDRFERVLALRPNAIVSQGNAGLALLRLGRLPEAIERFQRVLAASPNWLDVRSTLGGALIEVGKPAEAVRELEPAVRLDPDHVASRVNLGLALHRLDRPREAIEHFRRAVELAPTNPVARLGLVQASMALGEQDVAREHYRVLLSVDPRLAGLVGGMFPP